MAKDWAITELKQKIEDDILDENARKSILKLFANVIEKNYDINPSNWNVSYRTGYGHDMSSDATLELVEQDLDFN